MKKINRGSMKKRKGGLAEGDRVRRTYLGESAVAPEATPLDESQEAILEEVYEMLSGSEDEKDEKIQFLAARAIDEQGGGRPKARNTRAMLALRPRITKLRATQAACRLWASIQADLGADGMSVLRGISRRGIEKTLKGAAGAMFVREFITRTGEIVSAPPRPDWIARLRAAELQMRLLGLGKDRDGGTGPIVVQVVQYCKPEQVGTWPGARPGGLPPPHVPGMKTTVVPAALPPHRAEGTE